MRNHLIITMLICACIVQTACCGRTARAMEAVAKLSSVRGFVQVNKTGQDTWVAAGDGFQVGRGDSVKTGENSSCAIKWMNGNALTLKPLSHLKITRLDIDPAAGRGNYAFFLESGLLDGKTAKPVRAASGFEVRTPAAIARIMGAEFAMSAGDDETTIVKCVSGAMSVSGLAGDEVMLSSGHKTTVRLNEPPEKSQPLSAAETPALNNAADSTAPALTILQPGSSFNLDGGVCSRTGDGFQCTVSGVTEPGVNLTINNIQYPVEIDGHFLRTITMPSLTPVILIAAEDTAGNRATEIIRRIPSDVSYVEVSVSPGQLVANGVNTAAVTVRTLDFTQQPLAGQTVALSVSSGGTVAPASVVTDASGTATAVFTSGVSGAAQTTVTITAVCSGVSGAAILVLLGDFPPFPSD